ncbi:hypothetical protein L226DRAFT_573569 [Lentinus tigrinus ALCF2SS1-7]|uniref:Uncharacterized protein n=1 Tax=Lentinus tigrinus ALCF2SS1-6 TaxID=1328759 RepID=A0A5C2S8S2_9APHY|nr:hypothetical protein L227DRAFT_577711 [Lentinus tigrinus ALCF2SS1-6]RPD71898.1 hypothetical protein L226DRAFT_573569 [Lentinus tigrinus ALCF2SS1-7]
MKLSRSPIVTLTSRLRPCQLSALTARRCLGTLTRPIPSLVARHGPSFSLRRCLATESPPTLPASEVNPPKATQTAPAEVAPEDQVYHGPLTTTYRRLKIFSLSTLSLTFVLSPFIFVIETSSGLPLVARFALAGIAMGTSGISTSIVAWAGRPYVSTLRWLQPEGAQAAGSGNAIEMTTHTLAWHERVTTVYDTAFLVPTSRPFATWELAEGFKLPEAEVESARAEGLIPREETIAETRNKAGELLGRWVVSWDENGEGTCRQIGKVVRYFNVHKELLSRPIQ